MLVWLYYLKKLEYYREGIFNLKLNNPFIQAIGIIVMLAELPENEALKSRELSKRMNVSHSYLIKVAKKLKDADLINSTASKSGGYTLKKDIDEITFLDIFDATEGKQSFIDGIDSTPIESMFLSKEIVKEKRERIHEILDEAEADYRKKLSRYTISEAVPRDEQGAILQIDWKKVISEM